MYSSHLDAPAAVADAEVFWMDFLAAQTTRAVIRGAPRLRWVRVIRWGLEGWPLALMREGGLIATNGFGIGSVAIAETTVVGQIWKAAGSQPGHTFPAPSGHQR